jgi:hypothetical protein
VIAAGLFEGGGLVIGQFELERGDGFLFRGHLQVRPAAR